ncbi:basic phospholipase A2 trimucrotoxin [Protobothrops mucrosquamatus]|uniref:Basic phospholipase A2 trimucrotoxin n=3 Tax=Protobothrops TaxID=103943 RepID=PA2BT_PROMU|nr:basic phospholipase A2 trimucrotoxin [Protobothrops mucrosquamatus]Q90W39.1 RecName: Full=Basic phospholipase A2 trimucrotoxin; Short=svPLA2; AltName: Full=Phosphatidylcholine 2-acylhydrolase; AltName: Full=TMV-D49-PLA2; Flags: Precursor [Protobothrops mucrosquamatus]AAK97534.1 acidic phospholipase A2 [Protobothrops mucrosquamatus]
MRTLWIVAVLLLGVEGNLLQFNKMIKIMTKKNAIPFYSSYGCYCGWGGQGKPKDATDRCCFVHDCCYGKLTDCSPKSDIYSYSWKTGIIICGEGTECEKKICECDRAAAVCLGHNLRTYKKRYMFYPDFLCTDPSEKC